MRIDKQLILFLIALIALTPVMTSCSEEDDTQEEFADWANTNDAYFLNIYNQARQSIDGTWKIIPNYTFTDSVAALSPTNNIVVKVIEEGSGTTSPIYTDSVKVNYRGRLIPSPSYPEGYVFDESYSGEYVEDLITPSRFTVSGVIDGFATALQNMHVGDRWMVYIPYQLGYGVSDYTTSSGTISIPGGSTLIFDLKLVGYQHPGDDFWSARKTAVWVEE